MKILYHQSNATIKPYPRNDNADIVGLSSDYLVLTQMKTTPPEVTENQSLSSSYVVDEVALTYTQQWTVIDNPPVANWDNFNTQMMTNTRFNQVYAQCLAVAPIVANSLPTALDQVTSKGYSLFTLIWTQLCAIGGATVEDKIVWGEYAINNNLPQDFINILT